VPWWGFLVAALWLAFTAGFLIGWLLCVSLTRR
jgi:hypothetical protein